jgi:uncharacterized repeat protein (TIGR01451 family)
VVTNVPAAPGSSLHKQERDGTAGTFVDGPITGSPGDTIQYQLVYTNTGNANATNVTVTDVVPNAHATYVAGSCTGGTTCLYDAPSHTITWNLGTVQPGSANAVTLNFSILLDSVFPVGTTVLTNVGVVTATGQEPTNSNPVITNVPAAPASTLDKAQRDVTTGGSFVATAITAHPSDVLEYRLTYSNSGSAAATNVVVTDPIPARSTFLSCSTSCSHSASTVTWNLGTVAPSTVVLTFQVTLDSNFAAGTTTQIKNAAVVTTDQGTSPTNTVVATVTVASPLASGILGAATTNQPNTGQSDFARNMFLALVMVLLGITALAGQALFTSMRKEEQ